MVQAKNGTIIATIAICTAIMLGALFAGINSIEIPEQQEIVVPTAAEIAALVNVSVPVVDNSDVLEDILDQVDTRTDVSKKDKNNAIEFAEDELSDRDFKELIEDIVEIDEDDFNIKDVDTRDSEVTTGSEDDNEDGNFKVQQFIRVKYRDIDASDADVVYVVLTAEITDLYDDENDQEVEYSIEEVSRSFEFD